MLIRVLALGLLSSSLGLVLVAAQGCTNGTTPICAGDAGCGPNVMDDGSFDVVEDVPLE